MQVELHALYKNGTWELVPPSPGRNGISCKWIFRIKGTQMAQSQDTKQGLSLTGSHKDLG